MYLLALITEELRLFEFEFQDADHLRTLDNELQNQVLNSFDISDAAFNNVLSLARILKFRWSQEVDSMN